MGQRPGEFPSPAVISVISGNWDKKAIVFFRPDMSRFWWVWGNFVKKAWSLYHALTPRSCTRDEEEVGEPSDKLEA